MPFHDVKQGKIEGPATKFPRHCEGASPWQSRRFSGMFYDPRDCQKVNCPEGAREATLGCVGLCPPRNDVFFRHRRCRRAILESPLQIELLRRKKGPPLSGRPRCLEMFFPIRRAETVRSVQRRITRVLLVFRQATCRTVWPPALPGDWSGGFTRVTSSKIHQSRVWLPALPG